MNCKEIKCHSLWRDRPQGCRVVPAPRPWGGIPCPGAAGDLAGRSARRGGGAERHERDRMERGRQWLSENASGPPSLSAAACRVSLGTVIILK